MASLLSPAMAQSMVLRSIQRPRLLAPLHRSCAATSNKRFNSKLSPIFLRRRIRHVIAASSVEGEEAELGEGTVEDTVEEEEMVEIEATPEELEYISEIQRVSEFQCFFFFFFIQVI